MVNSTRLIKPVRSRPPVQWNSTPPAGASASAVSTAAVRSGMAPRCGKK
jgi:hypothetical protein